MEEEEKPIFVTKQGFMDRDKTNWKVVFSVGIFSTVIFLIFGFMERFNFGYSIRWMVSQELIKEDVASLYVVAYALVMGIFLGVYWGSPNSGASEVFSELGNEHWIVSFGFIIIFSPLWWLLMIGVEFAITFAWVMTVLIFRFITFLPIFLLSLVLEVPSTTFSLGTNIVTIVGFWSILALLYHSITSYSKISPDSFSRYVPGIQYMTSMRDYLIVTSGKKILVLDPKTYKKIAVLRGHNKSIWEVVTVNTTLYSTGENSECEFWDLSGEPKNWKHVGSFLDDYIDPLISNNMNPDGKKWLEEQEYDSTSWERKIELTQELLSSSKEEQRRYGYSSRDFTVGKNYIAYYNINYNFVRVFDRNEKKFIHHIDALGDQYRDLMFYGDQLYCSVQTGNEEWTTYILEFKEDNYKIIQQISTGKTRFFQRFGDFIFLTGDTSIGFTDLPLIEGYRGISLQYQVSGYTYCIEFDVVILAEVKRKGGDNPTYDTLLHFFDRHMEPIGKTMLKDLRSFHILAHKETLHTLSANKLTQWRISDLMEHLETFRR